LDLEMSALIRNQDRGYADMAAIDRGVANPLVELRAAL
jgi:hypothetical protein